MASGNHTVSKVVGRRVARRAAAGRALGAAGVRLRAVRLFEVVLRRVDRSVAAGGHLGPRDSPLRHAAEQRVHFGNLDVQKQRFSRRTRK